MMSKNILIQNYSQNTISSIKSSQVHIHIEMPLGEHRIWDSDQLNEWKDKAYLCSFPVFSKVSIISMHYTYNQNKI